MIATAASSSLLRILFEYDSQNESKLRKCLFNWSVNPNHIDAYYSSTDRGVFPLIFFCLICWGFELSTSEIFAATKLWRWKENCVWCSRHWNLYLKRFDSIYIFPETVPVTQYNPWNGFHLQYVLKKKKICAFFDNLQMTMSTTVDVLSIWWQACLVTVSASEFRWQFSHLIC